MKDSHAQETLRAHNEFLMNELEQSNYRSNVDHQTIDRLTQIYNQNDIVRREQADLLYSVASEFADFMNLVQDLSGLDNEDCKVTPEDAIKDAQAKSLVIKRLKNMLSSMVQPIPS